MKKIILILMLVAYLVIHPSNVFAAPIKDLEQGQIAIGIVGGNITSNYYLENKVSTNFTIGVQSVYNDLDFYGQFDLSTLNMGNNPKIIIGSRNLDSGSTTYGGLALTLPLADNTSGYSSLLAGDKLQELQLGVIHEISDNVALTFNYRIVKHNGTNDGFGFGLNCRI